MGAAIGVGVGAAARGGTKDATGSAGVAGLGWVPEATRWRSAGVAEVHGSGCADGPHAAAGGEANMLEGESRVIRVKIWNKPKL